MYVYMYVYMCKLMCIHVYLYVCTCAFRCYMSIYVVVCMRVAPTGGPVALRWGPVAFLVYNLAAFVSNIGFCLAIWASYPCAQLGLQPCGLCEPCQIGFCLAIWASAKNSTQEDRVLPCHLGLRQEQHRTTEPRQVR